MASKCSICGSRYTGRRADSRYCSAACRQRAHRLRADAEEDLRQEIDVTRRRYWELVARLAAVRGESESKVTTDLLSQTVTDDGYVYVDDELVGRAPPARKGWTTWGLEAGGPPWSAP